MNKENTKAKFIELRACVIIPTYNNSATIESVLKGVSAYTNQIIVVNDGCTDGSLKILSQFPEIQIINHKVNKGKGVALQTGFKVAFERGYRYAITIDSDGQHFPEDLPLFLEKVEAYPDSLIVGARNMSMNSVPGKSSFGHKFSNFWFKLETGVNLPDTQSGYRLYPLEKLKNFKWFTRKYEFEIEVLVRSSWSGIPVLSVPVKVFYAPKSERVSHFRPFRDFSRVSLLNSVLVIITLLYIKPRSFIRFFQKKNLIRFIKSTFFNSEEANSVKILSAAFGVFMGIFPIWGFQMIVGLTLCHFLRLNKGIFVLTANISIPPVIPIIVFVSHFTGGLILQKEESIAFNNELTLASVHNEMLQYYLGAVVVAIVAGILSGLISYIVVKAVPLRKLKERFPVNSDLA